MLAKRHGAAVVIQAKFRQVLAKRRGAAVVIQTKFRQVLAKHRLLQREVAKEALARKVAEEVLTTEADEVSPGTTEEVPPNSSMAATTQAPEAGLATVALREVWTGRRVLSHQEAVDAAVAMAEEQGFVAINKPQDMDQGQPIVATLSRRQKKNLKSRRKHLKVQTAWLESFKSPDGPLASACKVTGSLYKAIRRLTYRLGLPHLKPREVYEPLLTVVANMIGDEQMPKAAAVAIHGAPNECIQQFTSWREAMRPIMHHVGNREANDDPTLVLDWPTLRRNISESLLALIMARRSNDWTAIIQEAGHVLYQAGCTKLALNPREDAAVVIQVRFRQVLAKRHEAAVVIQAKFRQVLVGQVLAKRHGAAVVIQAKFRQVLAKRQLSQHKKHQTICRAATSELQEPNRTRQTNNFLVMLVRRPEENRKAVGVLQDILNFQYIEILRCMVSVWMYKVSRGRKAEQLADTMARMRSKRTKRNDAQLPISSAQRGGERRDSKDRKKENDKPKSKPGNQQINCGIISDADLEGLYYSPVKGQRLVEYEQNWSTQQVSNTVKHQVLSKEKAIEAAVKLARDTLY